MNLFMELLRDEHGFVLSAEMALLGTVGVIGATVGLSSVAKSVNDELTEVAMAFRSLDQSYHFEGASGCGACTAGSCYVQPPVEESLKALASEIKEAKAHEKKHHDADSHEKGHDGEKKHGEKKHDDKDHKAHDKDGDPQPPSMKKPTEKSDDKPGEMKKREELKKKHKEKLKQDEDDSSL